MAVVVAVTANKGGVGKSTTAVQVCAEATRRGRRVLAIDADKQADLTRYTGGAGEPWRGLDAVLRDPPRSLDPGPFIRPASAGFDVLGSSPRLTAADEAIAAGLHAGPYFLRTALSHVGDAYDLVIIDVGHSDAIMTNVFAVADALVLPTLANFPDAYHAGDMLAAAADVRELLHLPKLDLMTRSTISVWRRQHNGTSDGVVLDLLRTEYGERVSPAVIPHSAKVGEANKLQLTIREYRDQYGGRRDRPLNALVDAYSGLTEFVLNRLPARAVAA